MWSRWRATAAALALAACSSPEATSYTTAGGEVPAEPGHTYRWSFDEAAPGRLPADFIGVLGDWKVMAERAAPSPPRVLWQLGTFRNPEFPRVLVKDLTFTDLTLRVRCRPAGGALDEACGLAFRVRDGDNYYLARANRLESDLRLYRVVKGSRHQIGMAGALVTREWHLLEVVARGQDLTVSWDGRPTIRARDGAFARGGIGLWTKADSITAFDDLEAIAE